MKQDNKLIVFDINGTLLKKIPNDDLSILANPLSGETKIYNTKDYVVFTRPGLTRIVEFLHANNIDYMFWSGMTREKMLPILNLLIELGFNKSLTAFSKENCVIEATLDFDKKKKKKNLSCPADFFQLNVKNIVLIDNSSGKSVEGFNFIQCSKFDPYKDDKDEYKRIIEAMKNFIEKQDDDVFFKDVSYIFNYNDLS